MTIKHDAILPYYECSGLIVTAWPDENLSFEKMELTIAKEQSDKYTNIYGKMWDRTTLVSKLAAEGLEKTLDVTNVLCKSEIEALEKEKLAIIEYIKSMSLL
jgi:hypothetical protein